MGAHVALDRALDAAIDVPWDGGVDVLPPQGPAPYDEPSDPRFRSLLPPQEWAALPAAVRRRFSKRLVGGATAVYAGEVLETCMSRAGWLLAQAARLIGGP